MSKKSNTDAEDILSELENQVDNQSITAVSYTHLRAHETEADLV